MRPYAFCSIRADSLCFLHSDSCILKTVFLSILTEDLVRDKSRQSETHQKRTGHCQIYFPPDFHEPALLLVLAIRQLIRDLTMLMNICKHRAPKPDTRSVPVRTTCS